jgi:HAD superfamily hydrolase (TIGR01509 family)
MKIKGAIFDMDGTLIDSIKFWGYLLDSIEKKYIVGKKFDPSKEIAEKAQHMIYINAVKYIREHYDIHCPEDEFIKFCVDGIPEFYRTTATLKDGAREILADLKAKGIKLCLASATAMEYIKVATEHHEIAKYFDSFFSCADIGVGKDKPDIYLLALSSMGLKADEVCIVEDSCVAIETAKSIGCHTIGVYDENNSDQPRLMAASEIYLSEGESLLTLAKKIDKK